MRVCVRTGPQLHVGVKPEAVASGEARLHQLLQPLGTLGEPPLRLPTRRFLSSTSSQTIGILALDYCSVEKHPFQISLNAFHQWRGPEKEEEEGIKMKIDGFGNCQLGPLRAFARADFFSRPRTSRGWGLKI